MSSGFKGPIVHAPRSTQEGYKYRSGMGMMSSAEFCVIHEDFTDTITTNATATAALDKEQDDDVALEMVAALGKLGSAYAIQRLLRIAHPAMASTPGERLPPREAWIRIAAMEALVQARGYAVKASIESLANDPDPEVAAAVVRLRAGYRCGLSSQ